MKEYYIIKSHNSRTSEENSDILGITGSKIFAKNLQKDRPLFIKYERVGLLSGDNSLTNEMENTIDRILEISSKNEGKNLLQMTIKCMEELGELSEALLSYTDASGCGYKLKNLDNVKEEAVDVFIVATALMGKLGMSKEDIVAISEKKIGKWESKINK